MAMNQTPSSLAPKSKTRMVLGLCRPLAAIASRSKRAIAVRSLETLRSRIFSATSRRRPSSHASHTSLVPPCPMRALSRYRPRRRA